MKNSMPKCKKAEAVTEERLQKFLQDCDTAMRHRKSPEEGIEMGDRLGVNTPGTPLETFWKDFHKAEEGREPYVKPTVTATPLSVQVGGDHYKTMKIQPIEYIHANGLGFCEGSIVKYVSRWRSKNGIVDLEKARHVLDLLIELEKASDAS